MNDVFIIAQYDFNPNHHNVIACYADQILYYDSIDGWIWLYDAIDGTTKKVAKRGDNCQLNKYGVWKYTTDKININLELNDEPIVMLHSDKIYKDYEVIAFYIHDDYLVVVTTLKVIIHSYSIQDNVMILLFIWSRNVVDNNHRIYLSTNTFGVWDPGVFNHFNFEGQLLGEYDINWLEIVDDKIFIIVDTVEDIKINAIGSPCVYRLSYKYDQPKSFTCGQSYFRYVNNKFTEIYISL